MLKQVEYVQIEVFVDKFGNVERREYWRKVEGEQAASISARAYRHAVNRKTPFRVGLYGPKGQDECDPDED